MWVVSTGMPAGPVATVTLDLEHVKEPISPGTSLAFNVVCTVAPVAGSTSVNTRDTAPVVDAAKINIELYEDRVRIAPSVYNTMSDVARMVVMPVVIIMFAHYIMSK